MKNNTQKRNEKLAWALLLIAGLAISNAVAQDITPTSPPVAVIPTEPEAEAVADAPQEEAIPESIVPEDVVPEEVVPEEVEEDDSPANATPEPRESRLPMMAPQSTPQPPGADEFLPPSYETGRYNASGLNSPFERDILPPVMEAVDVVNELNDYRVVGIGKLRGKYLITVSHPKDGYKNIEEKPNKDGLFVISVADGTNPLKAKVRIKQGEKEAEISFDEKNLKATAKAAPGAPAQPQQPQNRAIQPQTPGQPGTNPAAAAQGNQALINHLRQSTQNPSTPPAGNAPEPKRRRVVLPPSR